MNRRELLKLTGAVGLFSLVPAAAVPQKNRLLDHVIRQGFSAQNGYAIKGVSTGIGEFVFPRPITLGKGQYLLGFNEDDEVDLLCVVDDKEILLATAKRKLENKHE